MYKALVLSLLAASCSFELEPKDSYVLKNQGSALQLKVLTFNILSSIDLKAQSEGYATWRCRRGPIFKLLRSEGPDLLAVQETFYDQVPHFKAALGKDYAYVGQANNTPDAVLFFKRQDFDLLEKGHWNLEASYNIGIRRIAVWAKLRHKASKRELMFVSTHLDAKKKLKIREMACLNGKLRKHLRSGAPIILAGDLNMDPVDAEFAIVHKGGWQDSFHPKLVEAGSLLGTYPYAAPAGRIDHVLFASPHVSRVTWKTLGKAGELPLSDHHPVAVTLHIGGS